MRENCTYGSVRGNKTSLSHNIEIYKLKGGSRACLLDDKYEEKNFFYVINNI